MELNEIKEITTVSRGEYIFHTPTQTVVLVGKVNADLEKHFQKVGSKMAKEWKKKAGKRGSAVLAAYK